MKFSAMLLPELETCLMLTLDFEMSNLLWYVLWKWLLICSHSCCLVSINVTSQSKITDPDQCYPVLFDNET